MTDMDLILSDIRDIMKRLTPGLATFQELSEVYESVVAQASAEGQSADLLYSHDLAIGGLGYLSSGIADLDALLRDGIGGVRVLEISGYKGAGKSVSTLISLGSGVDGLHRMYYILSGSCYALRAAPLVRRCHDQCIVD